MDISLIPYILFFISFLLSIAISLAIIIVYYSSFSEKEYIWFCSKILTIQKIVSDNNEIIKAFYGYNEEGKILVLKRNYLESLKLINKNGECTPNYRQCGILDTYGNKFCFSNNIECSINEIIIDSSSKTNEYLNNGYNYYIYENTGDYLYYKTGLKDKEIIAYWNTSNSFPLYINENNFIFDIDAFEEIFGSTGKEYNSEYISKEIIDGSIDWAGDLLEDSSKFSRIQKLIIYINEKIYNDENNIDNSYTKVYHNEYVKSYLGFENEESIKKFWKIDFSLYKNYFPNYLYVIISFSCGAIFLLFLTINTIIIVCLMKNKEIDEKSLKCYSLLTITIYGPIFLIFFIFCLFNISIIKDNTCKEYVKKIRADKFIENFLKDFCKHVDDKSLILCSIILLSISALLFIVGLIFGKMSGCIKEKEIKENNERIILQYRIARFMANINFPQQTENREINSNVNKNSNIKKTTENTNKNNEYNDKNIEENIKEENLEEIVI